MLSLWSSVFIPPATLQTERIHLEPLGPHHINRDYKAIIDSRDHLSRAMQWENLFKQGFSQQDDWRELQRHWKEFLRREAYAYAVLRPSDLNQCIGSVYLKRWEPESVNDWSASLTFWIVESELAAGLMPTFLQTLLEWLSAEWPIDYCVIPLFPEHREAISAALDAGLNRRDKLDRQGRIVFEWVDLKAK